MSFERLKKLFRKKRNQDVEKRWKPADKCCSCGEQGKQGWEEHVCLPCPNHPVGVSGFTFFVCDDCGHKGLNKAIAETLEKVKNVKWGVVKKN